MHLIEIFSAINDNSNVLQSVTSNPFRSVMVVHWHFIFGRVFLNKLSFSLSMCTKSPVKANVLCDTRLGIRNMKVMSS